MGRMAGRRIFLVGWCWCGRWRSVVVVGGDVRAGWVFLFVDLLFDAVVSIFRVPFARFLILTSTSSCHRAVCCNVYSMSKVDQLWRHWRLE